MDTLSQDILELIYFRLNNLDKICFRICCKQNIELLPKIKINLLKEAITLGDLSIIKFINPEKTTETFNKMIKGGHLEILQWAVSEGYSYSKDSSLILAWNGNLELLRWLRSEGCSWDEYTCMAAARGGHLEVLQWLHEAGCPWDDWTCHTAAKNGHLEVLKWAISNGCSFDSDIGNVAASNGHLEILKWLKDEEFPMNMRSCEAAVTLKFYNG